MKRRVTIALCLMTLATSAFALTDTVRSALPFIGHSGSALNQNLTAKQRQAARNNMTAQPIVSQVSPDNSSQTPAPEIPKHVIYGMLFKETDFFKKKALEQEQKGEDGSFLRNFHKTKLKVNDAQFEAFDRIASATARKMSKLDEQAKKIIDKVRAQHPDGKLKEGEEPPPPPAELKGLDNQRIEIILQAREQLREALGEAEFQRLETLLLAEAAKTVKAIRANGLPTSAARQPDFLTPHTAATAAKGD